MALVGALFIKEVYKRQKLQKLRSVWDMVSSSMKDKTSGATSTYRISLGWLVHSRPQAHKAKMVYGMTKVYTMSRTAERW
jgi:hypothetical protein